MLDSLVQKLKSAKSVVLSTHRNSDGDGLGAQIALYYGLRKLGKQAVILNPDRPAKKYGFLNTTSLVQTPDSGSTALEAADLALVLDTNDRRLVEPLMTDLERTCDEVVFVDHHPVLEQGPKPNPGSYIDVSAASTGEIVFDLLRALNVEFDAQIARALYTSVVFDTQNFRYVKASPKSHVMAAELLKFERKPEEVHRGLFATYTVDKMSFFARTLAQVEYGAGGRIAIVRVVLSEALKSGLEADESGDAIDQVMNIESVEVAALIREDAPEKMKLSFRSKGTFPVLALAEKLGGGGHLFASGAYISGQNPEALRANLKLELESLVGSSS